MSLAGFLIKLLPVKPVFAHCDIPCGIYDPHTAQLAAKTVLKMVQKINELDSSPAKPDQNDNLTDRNNFVRMVMVKEEHAELCKKEVLILWTDYFKDEHLKKFPNLHDLIWKTTKLCSDNKRMIDEAKAQELIEAVDVIADIFEQTKK
ncbi:superoxide dismutase, Ni [Candidatus Daviesbacteria bacterium]|nr:superoxide dismutase, Ni [Candidatus Daviesbacteria bacterium]